MSSYFYSGQIRRFLQQFIRVMSNFEVSLGRSSTGTRTLMRVPVYYGDSSRQVASILQQNSENNLNSVPAMSVYVSAFTYDRARVQEPYFVSKMQIRERAYDEQQSEYTEYQGDLLTVERLMPVPYLLTLKLDIWTSNTDQKFQLLEQMAVLFNPSMELQSTDSYVDWTSLSYITLTDSVFSSRSVPVGTEEPIDVAQLTFELPIWISPPARVKKQGVIQKIIASVYDPVGSIDHEEESFDIAASLFATKKIFTPIDLNVVYTGNQLQLFVSDSEVQFNDGVMPPLRPGDWPTAIQSFGELAGAPANTDLLVNGLSQIRLENEGITVVGTVAYHPVDRSILIFNADIDTLPVNTLPPVDAIIDPYTVTVDASIILPPVGTRYLLVNPIGHPDNDDSDPFTIDGPELWNRAGRAQLRAPANDIIEYDGGGWSVVFDSTISISVEYVTNLRTGTQYKWKDNQWTKSVEGRYGVGAWSFVPNN